MAKKKNVTKKKATAKKKPAAKKKAAAPKQAIRKKKPAVKKKTASKPAAKKKPVTKKPVTKKPVTKKPVTKKPAAKKPAAKKPVAKKSPAQRKTAKKAAAVEPEPKKVKSPFAAKDLRQFRKLLLNLRDRIVDEISFLAGDNLHRSQRDSSGDLSTYSIHMADQGTDNFDREFALNLVSSEQDLLYEIDEALRRIDDKTYGVCEISNVPIERARLEVIPYARNSVAAQSELEKGRTRYRPFGPTLSQSS